MKQPPPPPPSSPSAGFKTQFCSVDIGINKKVYACKAEAKQHGFYINYFPLKKIVC